MASHRVVTNGVVYEVEDGERLKPKDTDEVELLKCACAGTGCEDITIEFPGVGFVVRNTGTHRARVSMRMASTSGGIRASAATQLHGMTDT